MGREVRVGLLVIIAFIVLGVGVFLVSERRNLFTLKNTYSIDLESVSGLAQGSPVHLDGVGVGSIRNVVVDNMGDPRHVNATGGDVGCNQDGDAAPPEARHRGLALALGHVPL